MPRARKNDEPAIAVTHTPAAVPGSSNDWPRIIPGPVEIRRSEVLRTMIARCGNRAGSAYRAESVRRPRPVGSERVSRIHAIRRAHRVGSQGAGQ